MKDYEFNSDNIIKFKSLTDKMGDITDIETDEEELDLDKLLDSGSVDLFKEILSEELCEPFEPVFVDSLYEEIVDNYFILMQELDIDSFNFFRFVKYDYCRKIIIDKENIDLDAEFCHDDLEAMEALCAIDCLIADADESVESILKKVESMINKRNRED